MNTSAELPRNNMKSPNLLRETIVIGRKWGNSKMISGRNNYNLTKNSKKEGPEKK
jgi:hypothetical protein